MSQSITLIYKISHHHRERILTLLIASILIVACSYIFLLQKAIVNVVQRQKVAEQSTTAAIAVGDLEQKYFALTNTITLDLAYSKGLKNSDITAYISKKPVTAMALHNEL